MMKDYNINQTTLKILRLYASSYERSLHLREIARETDVDVKAVQLQLKRLERDKRSLKHAQRKKQGVLPEPE